MTATISEHPGEDQARRLESASEQIAALLRQPDVARRLRSAGGEDEWSALQIMGHLVEMIPYWLNHCRALSAATAEPPVFGRTLDAPERLAGVEHGETGDLAALLDRLNEEVQAAARAIRAMSPAERSKTGVHIRRGEVTVADVVEIFIVAHIEDHLAQMRAALGR